MHDRFKEFQGAPPFKVEIINIVIKGLVARNTNVVQLAGRSMEWCLMSNSAITHSGSRDVSLT